MKKYISMLIIGTFIIGMADIAFAKKRYHHRYHRYYNDHRREGLVGHTVRSTEHLAGDTLRSTGDFLESR